MFKNLLQHSKNWRNWIHGLYATLLTGFGDAGYQYFTHKIVDWKEALFFGLAAACFYLKASPAPKLEDKDE